MDEENTDKMTQKERRKIEIQKRKFQLEQERVTKPGECNKYLTAIIDQDITSTLMGSKIVEKLNEININSSVIKHSVPNTITWKRRFNQKIITETGEIINFQDVETDEPYLMIIMNAEEFINNAKQNRLLSVVQAAQEITSGTPVTTLVVYGLKNYCKKHRNAIGMKETEIVFFQLEIMAKCSQRLHETPDDLALTVMQISKAIAEEPFKSKQAQKLDQEQLYLTSDTKVSAKEDDPTSLARLWHAQLTCLPKVTFDVAQSLTKEYPMPRKLFEAYKKNHSKNEQMLADIPIIKTGPLSKARRIGPELSRKIATLMASKNPNDLL